MNTLQTSMSASSTPPILPGEMPPTEVVSTFARFRDSVADSLFFVSRSFPKVLTLRSSPSAWTGFRILLGVAGAALVVLPLSLWNAWAFAPVGLALFLLAVLLPPLRRDRGSAQAIEQLGAYLVLDGGIFSPANNSASNSGSDPLCDPADHDSCAVNFYLTPTRVWALDSQLRPLAVIPANEISMATAFPSQSDWILRVRWQENSAEFIFDGLFAERRARLAEAGLRHLIQQKEHSPVARASAKAAGA
jgi:hypothetical protein